MKMKNDNVKVTSKSKSKYYNTVLITSVILLILIVSTRMFIVFPVKVEGNSMDSTLITGEKYLVNKLDTPEKGDIIVFKSPYNENKNYVKRVIATEGDTIEIKQGKVYINGEKIEEKYLEEHINSLDIGERLMEDMEEIKLNKEEYFVMGDNRLNSTDSRVFGEIEEESIKGVLMKNKE